VRLNADSLVGWAQGPTRGSSGADHLFGGGGNDQIFGMPALMCLKATAGMTVGVGSIMIRLTVGQETIRWSGDNGSDLVHRRRLAMICLNGQRCVVITLRWRRGQCVHVGRDWRGRIYLRVGPSTILSFPAELIHFALTAWGAVLPDTASIICQPKAMAAYRF